MNPFPLNTFPLVNPLPLAFQKRMPMLRHTCRVAVLCAVAGLQAPVAGAVQVADLPECKTDKFQALLAIDHSTGDFSALASNAELFATCTLPPLEQRQELNLPRPVQGVINFETPHVHPLALGPNGEQLLAVNTAANTLEVFSVSDGEISPVDSIPVGHDPVSVRFRSAHEAWVVNQISDSISVVDLRLGAVIRTLYTANEPADVVFAHQQQRAFVSIGESNSVAVYDLQALDAAPLQLKLEMEEPRALAISADGSRVYAAAFESGNSTTAISGRPPATAAGASQDVLSRFDGPYGGQNPPPNQGDNFSPALTAGSPGGSSLIVRKSPSGGWFDDNARDWSRFVSGEQSALTGRVSGWDLADNDIAHIDTQDLSVRYSSGLMNINMAIAASPTGAEVLSVGTDARNEVRFEQNLNGRFLRVLYAQVNEDEIAQVQDLNPHLDYQSSTVEPELRQQSVGDPRAVAWHPSGNRFYVAGMGSNSLVETSLDGARLGQVAVGQGPTGLVIATDGRDAYVLNRFEASISRVDLDSMQIEQTLGFYDPTPEVVQRGRPHLYNTHATSGLGHVSCASCHVDARTDRLAWDLGVPDGDVLFAAHPAKGPLLTQSLVDISRFSTLHWRGDRAELRDFNATFSRLQGAPNQLGGEDIDAMDNYLSTVHFPPNPYRKMDNTLSTAVPVGDGSGNAVAGRQALNACLGCHGNGLSRSNEPMEIFGQHFTPPAFHGFYKRLGFEALGSGLSGFGMFHDGADTPLVAAGSRDLIAALMSFEGPENDLSPAQSRQDTHAAVGQQLTVGAFLSTVQRDRLSQLLAIADNPYVELVAKRGGRTGRFGYLYTGNGLWQTDVRGQSIGHEQLLQLVDASHPLTLTVVVAGTGERLGLDHDLDGEWDGADRAAALFFVPVRKQSSLINVPASYQLQVNGGGSVLFEADGLPPGLVLDSQKGLISGVPSALGEYSVLFSIEDAQGRADAIVVNWHVLDAFDPDVSVGRTTPWDLFGLVLLLISILRARQVNHERA